jgi:hypothetical protein
MGPDRRHPVKARAVRAPINPSTISKGYTEVEPSWLGLEQPAGRTADAIDVRARFSTIGLQQHRSLLGLEPVDHFSRRGGLKHGAHLVSLCARLPGRSFYTHSDNM